MAHAMGKADETRERGVTIAYIGNHFEYTSSTNKRTCYYAGGVRVAMRNGSTLYFLLGDHLGSTSITATSSGEFYSELRYMPWGGNRYTNGMTPTTFRYTGQREAIYLLESQQSTPYRVGNPNLP
jgi:hypothetical protein